MAEHLLRQLDDQIRQWAEELQRETEARDNADERILELRQAIRNSLEVRPSLAKAEGLEKLPDIEMPALGIYDGVREAYHTLAESIAKQDGWTLDELVPFIASRDIDFGPKSPRRVLNMALINDPYVELLPGQRFKIHSPPKPADNGR
ncbi:MAG: hypothetical protein Q7K03_10230 [Dehalococcoidia bacterium]|nr:hypothetical protein [Dehalococcoidia bacterium]